MMSWGKAFYHARAYGKRQPSGSFVGVQNEILVLAVQCWQTPGQLANVFGDAAAAIVGEARVQRDSHGGMIMAAREGVKCRMVCPRECIGL